MGHSFGHGFSIGVGGGAVFPMSDLKNAYNTGWNVTVPIAWQSMTWPVGVRLDLSYEKLGAKSFSTVGGGTTQLDKPALWNGMLDLTYKVPFGFMPSGSGLYVLGGGGVHRISNYGGTTDGTTFTASSASTTKFGWNAGGGLTYGFGMANLFVEGRYVSIMTDGRNTNTVPVVVGVMTSF